MKKEKKLGSLPISSSLCLISFAHPPMLEQTLKPVLEVSFQIVQPRLGPRLTRLDTPHYNQLELTHESVHILPLPEVKSHVICMLVEVFTNPITSPLHFIPVAIVSSPHLHCSLPHILTTADATGSKIHHMGAQTGVVSSNLIFSSCFRDFHFRYTILHACATYTSFIMIMEISSWSGWSWGTPIRIAELVSHYFPLDICCLPCYYINGGENLLQFGIFMQ